MTLRDPGSDCDPDSSVRDEGVPWLRLHEAAVYQMAMEKGRRRLHEIRREGDRGQSKANNSYAQGFADTLVDSLGAWQQGGEVFYSYPMGRPDKQDVFNDVCERCLLLD